MTIIEIIAGGMVDKLWWGIRVTRDHGAMMEDSN